MTPPLRLDEPRLPAAPPPGLAPLAPLVEITLDPAPPEQRRDAWAERGPEAPALEPRGGLAEPRPLERVGAGLGPRGEGGDEPLGGSGRLRSTGLLAKRPVDGASALDGGSAGKLTLEERYPIRATGFSATEVAVAARSIDADGDGKLSQTEVDSFGRLGRDRGFADAAARDAFRRYEAGAALLATQAPGGAGKSYLDGAWTKEMEKLPGASAGELAQVRKTLLPQAILHLGKDVLPELAKATEGGIDARELAAAKGVLRSRGYGDVAIIDADGDGHVGKNDRFVRASGAGLGRDAMTALDEINAARGLNRAMEAYDVKKPAFLARSRADAFPSDLWEHQATARPGKEPQVGYKLKADQKGSDAVKAFRDSPGSFKCDCATAKQMFALNALMEQMGEAKFDQLVAKHGLWVGFGGSHQDGALAKAVTKDVGDPSLALADYDAGWMGYATVSVKGRPDLAVPLADAGWAGEHFIVSVDAKGEKQVLAHPFGAVPAAKFEEHLRAKVRETIGDPTIKDEDIIIGYKQPTTYDPDKAMRSL